MIAIDLSRLQTAKQKQALAEAAELAARKFAARRSLDDTDWYVSRLAETGQDIPEAVRKLRAEARLVLNCI